MAWALTGTRVSDFSGDIPTGYVNQYAKNFLPLAQQAIQKVAGFFTPGQISGNEAYEDFMKPFETTTGKTDATAGTHDVDTADTGMGFVQVAARWEKTQWQYPEQYRRRVTADTWRMTLPFEPLDAKRVLTDPKGQALMEARKNFNRKIDSICLTALGATVSQGTENAGTWTWTDTALPTAQKILNETPFAVSFLQEFQELFIYNEEEIDMEMPVCILEEKGWSQLFGDEKFINMDYNPNTPLGAYKVREYMGIMFIRMSSKRMSVTNDIVTSYCWVPSAMKLSTEQDLSIEASKRHDMNGVDQVKHQFSMGAFRLRDTGVIQFTYAR